MLLLRAELLLVHAWDHLLRWDKQRTATGLVRKAFTKSAGSALEHAGINDVGSACGPPLRLAWAQIRTAATVSSSRCIRWVWDCAESVVMGTSRDGREPTREELDRWAASFPIEPFSKGWSCG